MEYQEVLNFVIETIAESSGIEKEKIKPDSTLFGDLGLNSVDLVDILYTLEMEYDISLKIRDFERDAERLLNGKPYKIDRKITEDGVRVLVQLLPELEGKVKPGITDYDVVQLLTVGSLARMVHNKIQQGQ